MIRTKHALLALSALLALALIALVSAPGTTSAGKKGPEAAPGGLNPADFSTTIDNPLFPLSSLGTKAFEGQETDPETGETVDVSLVSTVLAKTTKVAGIQVLVLEELAYEDGVLVERALDYFAQHRDGTVYYFGEKVSNYADGKFVDHSGSWIAGRHGASPGIIMPADPVVGQTFNQENAPGVAEDQAEVIDIGESIRTPAGRFTDCVVMEDTSPLDPGVIDTKWYCPGIGLVRDEGPDGFIELVSYTTTD
jgi:hypothetical protein